MKAVIYARVSSREQDETGYSLPSQVNLLKEYATRRGLTVVKIFSVAESASGAKEREVFREMMEYMVKNSISILLCEKVDRLTRNLKEAVVVNDWVEKDTARQIHFVKQNLVIHKDAKSDEKFRWDIEIVLAKKYIANLSEEVKKGQAEKIRQGGYPTKPPLGYKTVGEKGHKMHVLDEESAAFVRKAFEYYSAGTYSLRALKEKLYEDGLRTRQGFKLSTSRLAEILSDPFYYGAIRWNDAILNHRGLHEPIVSKDIFNRVQEVMNGRTAPHFNRHLFQFTKMIKCGECGGTISGYMSKGNIRYECKHGKKCAQKGTTIQDELEKQLMGIFDLFEAITPEEALEMRSRLLKDHKAEADYIEASLERLQHRYTQLEHQKRVIYDDRLNGEITVERWKEKQAEILNEQQGITDNIAKLKSEGTRYREIYSNLLDLACRARALYEKKSPAQRRMMLKQLFSNLTLKEKKLIPVFVEPLEKLAVRVQKRIDAKINFERQKALQSNVKSGSDLENDFLLRG